MKLFRINKKKYLNSYRRCKYYDIRKRNIEDIEVIAFDIDYNAIVYLYYKYKNELYYSEDPLDPKIKSRYSCTTRYIWNIIYDDI